ncbi:MAG: nitroreductase [Alphaproteobacteria bacterium]|nr:nitroreductase [Alphaproteobacteria bacterium]MBU1516855.1 nitroreductase [Alphaproteobacteria bacterium]MBU2092549.1 nitroreductase [Alphaproteobacteria bacterium]MBU2151339.1 nitroreductase [Alphaproteobacteria bacterium]MBU2309642.1 nitroreductase [Alphaproteobacteria bacterium]
MPSDLPPTPDFGAALPFSATPEVLRFLALRRSTSAVTLAEPAPSADQLADLLRIAARAPDHGKLAPWRFVVLEGDGKAAFTARLDAVAEAQGDAKRLAKLAKLKIPPLALVVISSPKPSEIPEWEQVLSAGAVCTNLVYAALAMGFGANWITDWYSYDADATAVLGLKDGERVAGFVMLGTAREPPLERERPVLDPLITRWVP